MSMQMYVMPILEKDIFYIRLNWTTTVMFSKRSIDQRVLYTRSKCLRSDDNIFVKYCYGSDHNTLDVERFVTEH